MDKEKLIQFALGNIRDAEERNEISQYLLENVEARKFYNDIKNTWALTKAGDVGNGLEMEYKSLSKKMKGKTRRLNVREYLKYAAVSVIAVAVSYAMFTFINQREPQAMNEVICPAGQIAEVVLSDGTHVWLNAETSLRYPAKFKKGERNVKLEGEAFFEVESNPNQPFIVDSRNMQVKVTGTRFNLSAYPESRMIETTLVEGKVELFTQYNQKILDLNPGEKATYDLAQNEVLLAKVDTRFYSSWIDGKMRFNNEKLESIMTRLERWYNVEFVFRNEEIKDYRFSGTILKHKPLYQVMEIIKISSPIEFEIIQHDDTKNQIILFNRKK